MWSPFSRVWLFVMLWTIAFQAPLSTCFPRQEYWSALPFASLADLPNQEMEPESLKSLALARGFFTTGATWEALLLTWSEVKVTQLCPTLQPHGLCSLWNSPGQNTGVGSLSLLQGIFPTHGSNPGLLHCRWILYQLSHKGSPRILEWVAYPFSSGCSWPRNRTLPAELSGKPWYLLKYFIIKEKKKNHL